jgi:hypothetical protein
MKRSILIGAIAAVAGSGLSPPAIAGALEEKYAGKTITIIYCYGAGGTYGKTSILLSRYLGKNIRAIRRLSQSPCPVPAA